LKGRVAASRNTSEPFGKDPRPTLKNPMTIRAVYFDEYGRKESTSEETLDDILAAQRGTHITSTVPQMTPGEAYLLERGTQKRPTSHHTRLQ
jgi:hypothetical protein